MPLAWRVVSAAASWSAPRSFEVWRSGRATRTSAWSSRNPVANVCARLTASPRCTWMQGVSLRAPELLLERERELELIELAAARAAEADASMVLIEGSAGVGKTRLLREAAARVENHRFRVLSATGGEVERELGWGSVRQLFGSAVESDEHHWSGAARLSLPIFSAARLPTDASVGAVLHGLHWMATQLAEEGLLLVIVDDVQWADPPSLRWLAYMSARLDGLRALFVVAIRTGEASG